MHISPLYDKVLLKRIEEENKTAGGIIIPDNHTERPIQGEVVAVGPGKMKKDGTLIPLTLKQGDRVIFGKYAGNEVKLDGQEYLIMKEEDILGVVK